jgi:ABC-type Fe3+-hydroxamate transport system substrate-binding protein
MRGSEFVEYPADVMVFCVEGLDAAACRNQAMGVLNSPRFSSQPAVRNGRIACVDGAGTFGRRGPGLVDCFEWLVAWLNRRTMNERVTNGRTVSWVEI